LFSKLIKEQPLEALTALVCDEIEEISADELKVLAVSGNFSPEAEWDQWWKKLFTFR